MLLKNVLLWYPNITYYSNTYFGKCQSNPSLMSNVPLKKASVAIHNSVGLTANSTSKVTTRLCTNNIH